MLQHWLRMVRKSFNGKGRLGVVPYLQPDVTPSHSSLEQISHLSYINISTQIRRPPCYTTTKRVYKISSLQCKTFVQYCVFNYLYTKAVTAFCRMKQEWLALCLKYWSKQVGMYIQCRTSECFGIQEESQWKKVSVYVLTHHCHVVYQCLDECIVWYMCTCI